MHHHEQTVTEQPSTLQVKCANYGQMKKLLLLFLLVLPFAAAASQPDAAIAALTSMEGRYTIGPWEGSTQGNRCLLANSEPLSFADFELSGVEAHEEVTLRITPAVPPQDAGQTLAVQVDTLPPVNLGVRMDEGGMAMLLPPGLLAQMGKGSFMQAGTYKYDLRGFARAYALFQDCIKKSQPASLPYEPLEESDPAPVAGKWQMITLKLGEAVYARYAMLGDTALGLWVHNVDTFVLSLTGPHEAQVTPATLNGEAITVIPQKDGVLIPLPPELLRSLEASGTLSLKLGDTEKSFDIKDFRAVVVALQPYE